METIKNYLESMFRNLPNTSEVLKAKSELLQMMEDKYSELIREGKSENEAVAKVIAEFGNLDEVASSLGIKEVIEDKKTRQRRNVTLSEVTDYISDRLRAILFKALGIFFFITCPVPVIILDAFSDSNWQGATCMFVFVAVAVVFMVMRKSCMEQWHFLRTEPCSISPETTDYVSGERRKFQPYYTAILCAGLVLCVCCVIPVIVLEEKGSIYEEIGSAALFVLVAVGVALMVYASGRYNTYKKLLHLNSEETIGGTYTGSRDKDLTYSNNTVRIIMSVYWPSITCIYLCISFLTFRWGITWLIWPIAGVVRRLLESIYCTSE